MLCFLSLGGGQRADGDGAEPNEQRGRAFNKPALHGPYNNSDIFFFVPLQKNSFLIKGRHRKKSIAKDFSVPLPPQVL